MWIADTGDDKLYAYNARLLIDTNSLSSVLTRVGEIAASPDLIVSMSASTNTVVLSNTITLAATVGNTGGRSAAATTLRWYLSTNNTIDTNDTELGMNALSSLAAGASMTISNTITVPNIVGTNYYYGACVDPVMDEYYTNNNCSSAVRVVVVGN